MTHFWNDFHQVQVKRLEDLSEQENPSALTG